MIPNQSGYKQQILFGESFLQDYAGRLITNPEIAIVELVANAWDAGADKINISWPSKQEEEFAIEDNGCGMTKDEFETRWSCLNYNRLEHQGDQIEFPPGNETSNRKVFGRKGKGRHSMFCFSSNYTVLTWKANQAVQYYVAKHSGLNTVPFDLDLEEEFEKDGYGTIISANIDRNYIPASRVEEIICMRFMSDPSIQMFINDKPISITTFTDDLGEERIVNTKWGQIPIRFIDSTKSGRTSFQSGIAWWVNKKLIGELSWDRRSQSGSFLDKRRSAGKSFTFIITADILEDVVTYDGFGFENNTEKARDVLEAVEEEIEKWLKELTWKSRKNEKREVIQDNRERIKHLSSSSKENVERFIDHIQTDAPTISSTHLSQAVAVMCTIEEMRSGKELIANLAKLSVDDMEKLNEILSNWSIRDAKVVLDELDWRLKLITELRQLVNNPSTDELQVLQPLFERGLWMFGPEFESSSYTSNKGFNTVIKKLFKSPDGPSKDMARKRPDYVALPDQSIGAYSTEHFDLNNEVDGIAKVIVVELKRGGFTVNKHEVTQAEEYCLELLMTTNIVHSANCITGYVLGSKVGKTAFKGTKGPNGNEVLILPMSYDTILRRAEARMFHLKQKIEDMRKDIDYQTSEIDYVLSQESQAELIQAEPVS